MSDGCLCLLWTYYKSRLWTLRASARRCNYLSVLLYCCCEESGDDRSAPHGCKECGGYHVTRHKGERLEVAGYRSPTWRVLRALKSLHLATQLQGESAVTAPPFFPNAGRGTVWFWGNESSIYQSFFTFPPSKDFINIKNIFFFFLRSKDIRNFPF